MVPQGRGVSVLLEKPVDNKRGAAPQHSFQWLCPLCWAPHSFLNLDLKKRPSVPASLRHDSLQ